MKKLTLLLLSLLAVILIWANPLFAQANESAQVNESVKEGEVKEPEKERLERWDEKRWHRYYGFGDYYGERYGFREPERQFWYPYWRPQPPQYYFWTRPGVRVYIPQLGITRPLYYRPYYLYRYPYYFRPYRPYRPYFYCPGRDFWLDP